jgi:hypothetical protein
MGWSQIWGISERSREDPTRYVSKVTRSLYSARNTPTAVPKTDLVDDFMSLQVWTVHGWGPPSVPVV